MSGGTVVALWRYPVKSMQGEALDAAAFTERGVLGDRAYGLVDLSDGKVASAKNPRKWPGLFDFRAAYTLPPSARERVPPVGITLPGGGVVGSEQPDRDGRLSEALGRRVTLESRAPEVPCLEEYWPDIDGLAHRETVTDEATLARSFFDLAFVHLLTTATLDRLRELYPEGRFEAARFRPNVLVDAGGSPDFLENAWIDRTLAIGDEVRLRITGPCPRCVMTTLRQGDLPNDPGILRTAAKHNGANVGVYAEVVRTGSVRRGDPVRIE